MQDGLVGAGLAVLAIVLLAVGAFWAVSEPTGAAGSTGRASGGPAPGAPAEPDPPQPPSDLGAQEIWLAEVTLDAAGVLTADQRLRDLSATGRDVRTGPDGLVAGTVTVQATVPFDVVADELGEGVTVRTAAGGRAAVVRTAEALGRELRVVATGTVEVVDGRLVVEPTSIDVGGPAFLADAIAAVVRGLVTIEHEIEGLPDGLVLRDVAVQDDGFRASLDGTDVRLVP